MRLIAHFPLLWSFFYLLLVVFSGAAPADEYSYRGEARNQAGEVLYTEKHSISTVEGIMSGSLTEYRAPDGALLATLRSDYSRSLPMPTYIFEDLQRNYIEGLRWEGGVYVIFSRAGSEPERSAPLTRENGVFSCQGWHYYLVNHLELLETDSITLQLVLPSELRAFPFVLRKLSSDESRIRIELRLEHWLFRYFAPKMRLEYDKSRRRLLEFQGLSNLLNTAGERQFVTILYSYPGG